MSQYLSLRVPNYLYRAFKKEALEKDITLSEVVRSRLLLAYEDLNSEGSSKNAEALSSDPISNAQSPHPLIYENNLLLRKIGRHLNSQIVREVDERIKLMEENHETD